MALVVHQEIWLQRFVCFSEILPWIVYQYCYHYTVGESYTSTAIFFVNFLFFGYIMLVFSSVRWNNINNNNNIRISFCFLQRSGICQVFSHSGAEVPSNSDPVHINSCGWEVCLLVLYVTVLSSLLQAYF